MHTFIKAFEQGLWKASGLCFSIRAAAAALLLRAFPAVSVRLSGFHSRTVDGHVLLLLLPRIQRPQQKTEQTAVVLLSVRRLFIPHRPL